MSSLIVAWWKVLLILGLCLIHRFSRMSWRLWERYERRRLVRWWNTVIAMEEIHKDRWLLWRRCSRVVTCHWDD